MRHCIKIKSKLYLPLNNNPITLSCKESYQRYLDSAQSKYLWKLHSPDPLTRRPAFWRQRFKWPSPQHGYPLWIVAELSALAQVSHSKCGMGHHTSLLHTQNHELKCGFQPWDLTQPRGCLIPCLDTLPRVQSVMCRLLSFSYKNRRNVKKK